MLPREVQRLLLLNLDLAGFAKLVHAHSDVAIAGLLDAYYRLCHEELERAGGRVLKYIGDAVLAVFEPQRTPEAVACVLGLERRVHDLAARHGMAVTCGGSLHLADVVVGTFGPDERPDVIGRGVNDVFLLGRGPGLRISAAVYHALPESDREGWSAQPTPTIYRRVP